MIKKLLFALLTLFAATAFAAVDANKADQATLETVKGIGPSISAKIIDERKKSPFKDWADMVERVGGIGDGNAAKFSAAGLTVNGASFKSVKSAPTKPADAKASAPKPADKASATKASDKK
jgi:competence protein ComEA